MNTQAQPAPEHRQPPDEREEEARAYAAVAFMCAGSLEVMARMLKQVDPALYRLVSDAWARALEVMAEQRARWRDLRAARVERKP